MKATPEQQKFVSTHSFGGLVGENIIEWAMAGKRPEEAGRLNGAPVYNIWNILEALNAGELWFDMPPADIIHFGENA